MNRNSQENRLKNYLVLVLLIYLVAGISILKYYRYQINPDGLSYISIAEKYLNGDFSNAVNGWWGPMFSWLLAPLLLFGVDPLLTAKILNLLIGVAAIIAVRALSYRFEMPGLIRTVILFSTVPVVLGFAFYCITPDLLLMCVLLFYFAVIFSDGYRERLGKGVLCGVLGAVAYLSKSFAFPFFVSHFLIMNVIHYFRSETTQAKKKVVHNFLAGAVVFALIGGIWVGLLSNKYGKLTFGTTGKASYRTKVVPGSQGLAILWQGFLKPSNETAMSAWEDPSYQEMQASPSIDFGPLVRRQLKTTFGLICKIAGIFMEFSVLSIAIATAYLLFWLRRFNIKVMPLEVLYPTVIILLYAGGYSLIWVRARYIWVLCVLLMLMGGYVLARLFQNNFFTKTRRTALLIIFFLSFAVPASQGLRNQAYVKKWVYNLSSVLKNYITPDCKIASNAKWDESLYISYYLNCKYYGVQKKNITRVELKRQLEEYGIDFYLVWGRAVGNFGFLTNYSEITGGRIQGLRIFALKKYK